VHTSPLPHTRHMPGLSHSSRFYHPHNIGYKYLKQSCYSPRTFHHAVLQRQHLKHCCCACNVRGDLTMFDVFALYVVLLQRQCFRGGKAKFRVSPLNLKEFQNVLVQVYCRIYNGGSIHHGIVVRISVFFAGWRVLVVLCIISVFNVKINFSCVTEFVILWITRNRTTFSRAVSLSLSLSLTHTHTCIYIYIYIYIRGGQVA
jgi:hypothetical protein